MLSKSNIIEQNVDCLLMLLILSSFCNNNFEVIYFDIGNYGSCIYFFKSVEKIIIINKMVDY